MPNGIRGDLSAPEGDDFQNTRGTCGKILASKAEMRYTIQNCAKWEEGRSAMTVDEFFSVCARMGFSRCGKGYARCLGDGVYQELSAPGTGYLSHSSPEFLQ